MKLSTPGGIYEPKIESVKLPKGGTQTAEDFLYTPQGSTEEVKLAGANVSNDTFNARTGYGAVKDNL
jgi:hypothetical protein